MVMRPGSHPVKVEYYAACMTAYIAHIKQAAPEVKLRRFKSWEDFKASTTSASRAARVEWEMFYPFAKLVVKRYQTLVQEWLDSPAMLYSEADVPRVYKRTNVSFYRLFRRENDVFMKPSKGGEPLFDVWSTDADNRSAFPLEYKEQEVMAKWPTTHGEALTWLRNFIRRSVYTTRASNSAARGFATGQDAMREDVLFGNHSILAPVMNIGLITPRDIIHMLKQLQPAATAFTFEQYRNAEAFVRQICWREYIRCQYSYQHNAYPNMDYLHAQTKPLPKGWTTATTGVGVVDQCLRKVNQFGYVSHIDRLMLLLNYLVTSFTHPKHIADWFTDYFVDGWDVLMPNIAMATSSLAEEPSDRWMSRCYIHAGANYFKTMGLKVTAEDQSRLREMFQQWCTANKRIISKDFRLKKYASAG